jgi:hypothetical protein
VEQEICCGLVCNLYYLVSCVFGLFHKSVGI